MNVLVQDYYIYRWEVFYNSESRNVLLLQLITRIYTGIVFLALFTLIFINVITVIHGRQSLHIFTILQVLIFVLVVRPCENFLLYSILLLTPVIIDSRWNVT